MKRTALKRKSKNPVATMRNKCDALLSPIIKKMYPKCLLCPNETEVAHHHIHKANSTRLRYEINNLINLCHKCHQSLHHNESYHASRIVAIKGIEWFQDLERKKNEIVKANREFYESHFERLTAILEE